MRQLLGNAAFDALCDNVFEMMSPDAQARFLDYVGVSDINTATAEDKRAAADEYIAHLAEKTDLTDAEKSVWDNIVKMIRTAIETLGLSISITDDVLSNLIKASYAEMVKNSRSEESVNENEGSEKQGVRFRYTEEEQSIVDDAKKNGTWMKAPNGKPTNLTEKQWAQVRTKAFKDWFGDWETWFKKNFLLNGTPVANLTGNESARVEGKTLTDQVAEYFDSMGNRALSPLYGDVILDRRGQMIV